MHLYCLENSDGERFNLNDETDSNPVQYGSLSLDNDSFTFENKIVARSGQPGSVKLGEARIESREIVVGYSIADENDAEYREQINSLLAFLIDVKYLIDLTEELRIEVAVGSKAIEYDSPGGTHFLSSDNTITFTALSPFWESTTETSVTASLTGGDLNDVEVENGGYLEVPAEIEIVAADTCEELEIYVIDTKQGLGYDDPLFGTAGYETLTISNQEGTILLGTADRSQYIAVGTGYFNIPCGTQTLRVIPSSDCDITIKFRERSFI